MESAIYQSLSRCEAIQMHRQISAQILEAYQVGINLMLECYEKDVSVLIERHRDSLISIGFGHIPIKDAAGMLALRLKAENVRATKAGEI